MSSARWRSERGSISVEVAVIAPAFVFLMLLVVYAGKVSEAHGNVERAAAEGAQAASLRQNPAAAIDDAEVAVQANLAAAGVPCTQLDTSVDTSTFEPGGSVTVTVRCDASMADVTLLGVPGTRSFTATSTEVIDTYRSDGP
jgi:Flp pilus assembly protein TadG